MPHTYITTSWDDGHPADLRIAEMLARHGLSGTFYVPRAIETGVMSGAQLRHLAASFEIGAHTLNHVFLESAPDELARNEISGSKTWVQDATGQDCTMFCPPGGKYSTRHVPMFRDAGFTGIRSVEFMSLDFPRPRVGGLLEMPTTLQAFPHPAANYLKNLTKRRAGRNFWLYAAHGHARNWPASARRLLEHALRVGGVFHLWGHSWEVEQTAQWSQLEEVLALLGEVRSQAPCLTNGQVCRRTRDGAVGAPSAA